MEQHKRTNSKKGIVLLHSFAVAYSTAFLISSFLLHYSLLYSVKFCPPTPFKPFLHWTDRNLINAKDKWASSKLMWNRDRCFPVEYCNFWVVKATFLVHMRVLYYFNNMWICTGVMQSFRVLENGKILHFVRFGKTGFNEPWKYWWH